MQKYNFTASNAKGDMILGLGFLAAFMSPVLSIAPISVLVSKYLSHTVMEYPVKIIAIILGISLMYFFMKKILKVIKKNYVVELDKCNIRIYENGYEIILGELELCEIVSASDALVRVDMNVDNKKISFRCRPEKYKTITGNLSFNPFGSSSPSDMKCLLDLGRTIQTNMKKREENTFED